MKLGRERGLKALSSGRHARAAVVALLSAVGFSVAVGVFVSNASESPTCPEGTRSTWTVILASEQESGGYSEYAVCIPLGDSAAGG